MFYTHKNGITFQKVEKEDLTELKVLKNESWFGTVNTVALNDLDQIRWLEKISNDSYIQFYIAKDQTTKLGLFGLTGIHTINRSCEFTHSIFASLRGVGYGKKTLRAGIDMAFEMFNLNRIETWILANNKAEMNLVQKIGFKLEGAKRQAVYKCGEYLDCCLFGLLRTEWDTNDNVLLVRSDPANVGYCNINYTPKK